VIAACLRRAGRYKEVSLPILWRLSQVVTPHEVVEADKAIRDLAKVHAKRVALEVYQMVKGKDELKARLREMGEKELVSQLETWDKP
jgi:hypothetical protein